MKQHDANLDVMPPRPMLFPAASAKYHQPSTWRDHARSVKRELQTYAALAKARPDSAHPRIKFCVFAPGRSGSTLLFDIVNTHPQIQCETHAKRTELLGARFLWPRRYVEARARLGTAAVYGFKLQLSHLTHHNPTDPQCFIRSLHNGGWKMIYLTRRNLFRQAISLCIASQTQVWHHVHDSNGQVCHLEKTRRNWNTVAIDIELLLSNLDFFAGNLRYTDFVMRDIPHLKLEYEDDLFTPAQQTQTMTRVCDFLGLEPHAGSTCFVRSSKDDLRDILENADEVFAAVRGTPYEHFLDAL